MAYRTILVHVQGEQGARASIDVAVTVAASVPIAHVIGLYVIPGVRAYPGMPAGTMSVIVDSHHEGHRKHAGKLQTVFEASVAGDGISAEWRIDESPAPSIATQIVEHGRAADLIVLAQPEEHGLDSEGHDTVGRVLVESGRPVLVVPRQRKIHSFGESVLLAWNSSKEAARASSDALPLLTNAKSVSVIFVNPTQNEARDASIAGSEIAASLARHGVIVEAMRDVAVSRSIGSELVKCASDTGCDLMVMGGYGHSRFRESILGGASRHVLEHMAVPVLFSH